MKKGLTILSLALIALTINVQAQDKARMQQYQSRLTALIEKVATAPTDNERYLASEESVGLLASALEEDGSERWQWQLPKYVSVLTSPDGLLRIFTWAVVRDDGEFECFGAVQFYNDKEEEYQYLLLNDKSEEIMNREESTLTAANWLGAVYQDIVQTTAGDRVIYTLLGWNGVDNLTERKIIEPVIMKGGVPQFGAAVFRRERNLRRIVLEYTNDAMVHLAYEQQTIQDVQHERVKVKGTNRYRTVDKIKEHKERVIIFDEVEPQVPGMEGLYQYYVPSGVELAYAFIDGKWELRNGAQGRLKDKKLNKPFEPIQKDSPSYNFNR
ncbi:MAG: hypothetical protein IKR33_08625 [Bacteroidales bacterium]|nr:hypothetical protein [Bacteroidales bacterium]